MKLTLIAAHDPHLVIGASGGLPWHYKEDLKHFKEQTLGKTILMGRGVFEELNKVPLPGRRNIVLSRSSHFDNVQNYSSLEEALSGEEAEEIMVVGGGEIYKQTINKAQKLIITLIKKEYDGDTWFPEYRNDIGRIWRETARKETDELVFLEYVRIEN